MASNTRRKIVLTLIVATVSASALGGYVWMQQHRQPVLEVFVFQLKSGIATLVRTPDDERILVNGGPNAEIVRKVSSVLPFYSRHLDAVVAVNTSDTDVSGLVNIIERYKVGRVYIPAITLENLGISSSSEPAYNAFHEASEHGGVELVELESGDLVESNDASVVKIEALFPEKSSAFEYSKASAPQIVLKVSYGNQSVLLLGDVTVKIQKYIASSTGEVDAIIVSHSASATNMSREFMVAARPEYLIYSRADSKSASRKSGVSVNKKAPPDPLAGILVGNRFNLREAGMVKITMDGKSIQVE
ncbi:MAG: hypothetical protein KBC33_00955 [Candidatus Pacebacteria bacterium]|nr:hypothetical protein [Candidatus Paceibacterota bacterium]